MASDINSGVIVGRVTRDAELRYTGSGQALCNFCIASNRRMKKGDQWIDEASFVDLTLWGKQAEGLNKYLVKGTQVAVNYALEQQRWESEGKKHSKLVPNVQDIQLLGGRREGGEAPQERQNQEPPRGEQGPSDPYRDDIPFGPHAM